MSSYRLIVKNLPRTATDIMLKAVFSAKGTVTDVDLKFAEDGKSRGFAFIGFKTKDEADTARKYFHKSYIGAIKIQVESCVAVAKPPPPAPPDMVEWLIAEDFALLQTFQNVLELPLSLLVVNLAQTVNWELAAEMVNMTSRTYRTAEQCKWRYENIVGPREEGTLYFESPDVCPSSPVAKNKKTKKAFIKVAPPSPSKAARYLKTSQLVLQDNNSQFSNMFTSKFETIKEFVSKRTLTNEPVTINPSMKSNKQSAIFREHGINYENPLEATVIAQTRMERVQMERKKLL